MLSNESMSPSSDLLRRLRPMAVRPAPQNLHQDARRVDDGDLPHAGDRAVGPDVLPRFRSVARGENLDQQERIGHKCLADRRGERRDRVTPRSSGTRTVISAASRVMTPDLSTDSTTDFLLAEMAAQLIDQVCLDNGRAPRCRAT